METIKDTLQAIGEAIRQHIIYILETQKYPLDRKSSTALKTLKVEVQQARNSKGQFQGFTPNAQLLVFGERYLEWLDRGRKPFEKRVPLQALIAWIKKRKIRGRNRRGKGRQKGQFISDTKLAFIIQSAIYKNGIRGRNFIKPAFDHGQRLVEIYLDNQLLEDMTYELDKTLKFRQ